MFKNKQKESNRQVQLYPLLGSDYISPKLLQYVTQLHSRSRQDSVTHTLGEGESVNSQQTQPTKESQTDLINIYSADHQNIEGQTPLATQDLIPLSPDPIRDIIIKNKLSLAKIGSEKLSSKI